MRLFSVNCKPLSLIVLFLVLTGCASSGGVSGGSGKYSVGPNPQDQISLNNGPVIDKPFIVVPVFDPNIPNDEDKIVEEAIWPEVRRTEAVRMSIMLAKELMETKVFDGARATPDTETSAHLYALGKIIKSNGEELDLKVDVVSIKDKRVFSKNYRFTVSEYALENPRIGKEGDLYEDFFEEIASDIASSVEKLSADDRNELARIEELRYAELFEPNFANQYIERDRIGNLILSSYPSQEDPMMRRFKALKVQDMMFIDNLQSDYQDFYDASNSPYVAWQRAAFVETKAARKASAKATGKAIFGTLALVAGAAIAANSGPGDYGQVAAGAAVAVGGLTSIRGAMGDSKQADAHRESLSELGKSLNVEIAPKVMELEETEVELKGSAKEQYVTWRSALMKVYKQENVPDIEL